MQLTQQVTLKQTQNLSPQFILAQQLLQMPVLELIQKLAEELNQNPALEMEDVAMCPHCHLPIKGNICENCGQRDDPSVDNMERFITRQMQDYDPDQAPYEGRSGERETDSAQMTQFASRESSFQDFLIYNFLTLRYPEGTEDLGRFLVMSINDDGYLEYEHEKVKELFNTDDETIEKVIKTIQTLEPAGVGARNAREALLIQLQVLSEDGKTNELAEKLIAEHFEDLGKNRLSKIIEALNVTPMQVEEAVDFIRRNLNPYPGRAYASREPVQLAKPAIVIRYNGRELSYTVLELADFRLKVNKSYLDMYENFVSNGGVSRHEMSHIRNYFKRAKFFLDSVESRKQTLDKIARSLCEEQSDFLIKGLPHFNSKLTQGRLAEKISMHESTISRAMSGKFVQTPGGEILSFDFFFDSSVRPKEYIKNIIVKENPGSPISDKQICEILREKGIDLARRTVAKYREELKIPSSYDRRRD